METVILNNGLEMPILGFGVYQVTDQVVCERTVTDAISVGYRLFDTASAYLNEEAVGHSIRNSGIPRNEFFITTKLWVQDVGYDNTRKAFEKSLKRLGLDYLDLYLIHQPYGNVFGAWRAMEELYEAGKIRAIGISNFQSDRVMDFLIHSKIKPAVNQIETHPFCQQIKTQQFLKEHNIQIESWAPFAEGKNNLFHHELLCSIGEKYNKSVAQVAIRWLIQRGIVAIPKSVRKERMAENFAVFDFRLDDEDLAAMAMLDTMESLFLDHRDPAMVKWISELKLPI